MILVDTRHRDTTTRHYTNVIKEFFPGERTHALHSPIAPHTTKLYKDKSSVGGQLIIITHKWSGALIDHFSDPSQLGLVSGAYLATGKGKLLVMGTYWPQDKPTLNTNGNSHGLWNSTTRYLKKTNHPTTSPLDYIKSIVDGKSDRHTTKSTNNIAILCGDFNQKWTKLSEWAQSNNWTSPSATHSETTNTPLYTLHLKHRPCSWIDHILLSPPHHSNNVVTTSTSSGPFWNVVTDHRPLFIHLNVPGGRGILKLSNPHHVPPCPQPRSLNIKLNNKPLVDKYQKTLDELIPLFDQHPTIEIASDQLLQACCMSTKLTKDLTTLPPKPGKCRSSYKNGWSPIFIAIKTQIIATLKILGHSKFTSGYDLWHTKLEQDIGIKKIITTWTKTVLKLPWKPVEEAHKIMNITEFGPTYWTTLPGMVDTKICIKLIKTLRNKLHGKQRHAERMKINSNVRHREDMVELGKSSQYIKKYFTKPAHTLISRY
jgi:hypothetical protein